MNEQIPETNEWRLTKDRSIPIVAVEHAYCEVRFTCVAVLDERITFEKCHAQQSAVRTEQTNDIFSRDRIRIHISDKDSRSEIKMRKPYYKRELNTYSHSTLEWSLHLSYYT